MAVITLKGLIDKNELGVTLPHEHIFTDLSFTYDFPKKPEERKFAFDKVSIENLHLLKNNPGLIKNNLFLDEEDLAIKELSKFIDYGGKSIVDVTSIGVSPKRKEITEITGKIDLNVILGTGFYIKESLSNDILNLSSDSLKQIMIKEFEEGIESTNFRAGIIGELGTGPEIGHWEEKLLKAAASAQKITGLAISVHIQAVPTLKEFKGELNGLKVLNLLEKAGADIEKTVICHADAKTDLKYLKKIAEIGAYVEFDHLGKDFYFASNDFLMDRDIDRITAIKELIEMGYTDKILISQDVCLKSDLCAYGGFGYAHILRDLLPVMKNKKISIRDINRIIIDNPARMLDIEKKYL